MGKNSRQRKAERRKLRQEYEQQRFLSNKLKLSGVTKTSPAGLIPPNVTIEPKINDLIEKHIAEDNFKLIFASYNHKECQLNRLNNQSHPKKLIELFNRITSCNQKLLPSSGIIRDNINKTGSYASLFDTVPEDTELKEADFSAEGRLFFYIYKNYFCIVAIKTQHLQ